MKVVQLKNIAVLFLGILVTIFYIFYLIPLVKTEQFTTFLESYTVLSWIVIFIFLILSEVLAPFPGTPAYIVSIAILGWPMTVIVGYLASTVSSIINFQISRKFGRKIVMKFVGKGNMDKVDEYSKYEGKNSLILLRLLGSSLFDYVSYAYGLTSFSFKKYLTITVLCHGFVNIIYFFVFQKIDFNSSEGMLIWYLSMVVLVPILVLFLRKFAKVKTLEK